MFGKLLTALKGFKVYLIAALVALVSLLSGGSPEDAANAATAQNAELGLVLAAGIAFGRALVSLFAAARARGVIQCNPLAVALAAAMLATLPLGGCASLGAGIEQARPQTAREALAEAEIGLTGAIVVATRALELGYLSQDEAQTLATQFDDAVALLNVARAALAARDEAGATDALTAARTLIRAASYFLSTRAEETRGGIGA